MRVILPNIAECCRMLPNKYTGDFYNHGGLISYSRNLYPYIVKYPLIENMTKVMISPMKMSDYPQVREVDILTQQQYLGDTFNEMTTEEQETHLVSKRAEFSINVNTGYCFVAESDDVIVGFILAHEMFPFHGTLFIRYIGINPAYQGKGIGLLLFQKLIEKAKENNIRVIQSLINTDNPPSVHLHKKVGFKVTLRHQAILEM